MLIPSRQTDDIVLDCSSLRQIAQRYNTSQKTIRRWLIANYGLTPEEIAAYNKRYRSGNTLLAAQKKVEEYRAANDNKPVVRPPIRHHNPYGFTSSW